MRRGVRSSHSLKHLKQPAQRAKYINRGHSKWNKKRCTVTEENESGERSAEEEIPQWESQEFHFSGFLATLLTSAETALLQYFQDHIFSPAFFSV